MQVTFYEPTADKQNYQKTDKIDAKILNTIAQSKRSNTTSTFFVESRNESFRNDDKRLTRKKICQPKKIEPHDAQIIFIKAVYNLTKKN
jgi:hypothetical protein